jgi:hypothetical protein
MPARSLWLPRTFLVIGAVQGFAIGITGLLTPGSVLGFPLETTPLNTRFVASFYLAGAIGLALSALGRRPSEMRVLLIAFTVVTVLLLAVTLGYWDEYTADGVPYPWLVSYIVEPVLGAFIIVRLRLWSAPPPQLRGPGALFVAEALLLGGLGVLLLAAPGTAIDLWPWGLTAVLSRTYGAIFVALGLGALLAAQATRRKETVPFIATSLVLAACGLLDYALHHSRFDGSAATDVWLAIHGVATVAFALALGAALRSPQRAHAVALEG